MLILLVTKNLLEGEGTCLTGCLIEGRNIIKKTQYLSIFNL